MDRSLFVLYSSIGGTVWDGSVFVLYSSMGGTVWDDICLCCAITLLEQYGMIFVCIAQCYWSNSMGWICVCIVEFY